MSTWVLVIITSMTPYNHMELFTYGTEAECRKALEVVNRGIGDAMDMAIYEPDENGFHYGPSLNCRKT